MALMAAKIDSILDCGGAPCRTKVLAQAAAVRAAERVPGRPSQGVIGHHKK